MKAECEHEFKKTLAQSGMWLIDMCHKCYAVKSSVNGSIYYPIKDKNKLK